MNNNRREQKYGAFIRIILAIGIIFFLSISGNIDIENIYNFIMWIIPLFVLVVGENYVDQIIPVLKEQTYDILTFGYSCLFILATVMLIYSISLMRYESYSVVIVVFLLNAINSGVVFYDIIKEADNNKKALTPFRHTWLIQGLLYVMLKIKFNSPGEIYIVMFFLGIVTSFLFKVSGYDCRYLTRIGRRDK